MSHSKERAEKICLNCNAQIHGRYCHVCGQENIDPRESFWSVLVHFFNDLTHFDGKFFKTVGKLLSKPGFLAQEFINGRRARYLHPIRMYLFTSFVFFLAFYAINTPSISEGAVSGVTEDSTDQVTIGGGRFNPLDTIFAVSRRVKPFNTIAAYDSAQMALPKEQRDGWIIRQMTKSNIQRMNKYGGRRDVIISSIINNFFHSFPYLLFVSLPITAFFLQLLYLRNRNNVYAGHAIFLVYLYIFSFITLLLYFGLDQLRVAFNLSWIPYVKFVLVLYMGLYTLLAFKRYYNQGWGKTIFKFLVWNFLSLIAILILFLVFFLISLLKV